MWGARLKSAACSCWARQPVTLDPAGGGDDAVGAGVVAAFGDGDERLGRVPSARDRGWEQMIVRVLARVHHPGLACLRLRHQPGQLLQGHGAQHEVDVGSPLEQGRLFLLGQAARDAHQQGPTLLLGPQASQLGVDLVHCLLADGAGVQQDEVRLLHGGHLLEAVRRQQPRQLFAVVVVHLAAPGLDVELHGFTSPTIMIRSLWGPTSRSPMDSAK